MSVGGIPGRLRPTSTCCRVLVAAARSPSAICGDGASLCRRSGQARILRSLPRHPRHSGEPDFAYFDQGRTDVEMIHRVNQLRAYADKRLVAIPATSGKMLRLLGHLREALLHGVALQDNHDPRHRIVLARLAPEPICGALTRLASAISAAESRPPAQPVAPDGLDLVPFSWVAVDRADLIQLGLAAQALGQAHASGQAEIVANANPDLAQTEWRMNDLVALAALLHGLLWLPWDDDVSELAKMLPAGAGRVVLDEAGQAAHQRILSRILAVWYADHPSPS